jgi:putative transposase
MKNNKNILSYAEYQKIVQNLKTPEEVEAFTKQLVAPVIEEMTNPTNEEEEEIEYEDEPSSMKYSSPLGRQKRKSFMNSPWYDVIDNEKEAMVIDLYAKGMSTRDISNYMKNIHGIDLAQPQVSSITDKVFPLVKEWQSRPLSSYYPVVYLDGLRFKVREAGKIMPKVAYIALGINQYGMKEVMGIWTSESEGAKFWLHVLNDMKNRGVEDVLFVCVDGLKGFPEAIKTIFPNAEVQSCIVHQIRHTIMFIPHKDRKQFCDDLKEVYTAPSEEAAMRSLKELEDRWPRYKPYLKSWEDRWADLLPFFNYPEPIRRLIYSTNLIENLNRQFRKVTKTTVIFPHDDALLKLLWLAQVDITEKWKTTFRNWGEIISQLTILFPDRVQF